MRLCIGLSLAVCLCVPALAEEVPGPWLSDYGKALSLTRESQNKPLLVVLDVPGDQDRCLKPIKMVQEDESQREVLAQYTCCRIDVSGEYGQKCAKAFGASSFPHTAIIDKTGAVLLYQQSGQVDSSQWLQVLSRYQDGERFRQAGYRRDAGAASSSSEWGFRGRFCRT